MTPAEAIELVLALAEECICDICHEPGDKDETAINIVRDVVLTHYKPEPLDTANGDG